MILQHFGSLRLPSRNPFDLRVKIIVVLQLGIISDHDVGRAESSSDAADHHLSNWASRSVRVDTPIFEATPITHDLYRWENAAGEPHPATIGSDLVL
jgi:hypothetical protein